jgi:hypothetical protein
LVIIFANVAFSKTGKREQKSPETAENHLIFLKNEPKLPDSRRNRKFEDAAFFTRRVK